MNCCMSNVCLKNSLKDSNKSFNLIFGSKLDGIGRKLPLHDASTKIERFEVRLQVIFILFIRS
jgi:hypothetical protein